MAIKGHEHKAPVRLRQKLLGKICLMLDLALTGGCCLALAVYLLNKFWAGYTWELITLGLCLGVGGTIFFLLAWQQLVVAPKRNHL
ncbi:putative AtpZ/AtpI family protein [Desulfarculales bacterium]